MSPSASPIRRPPFFRTALTGVVVVLLAGLAGAYQVGVRANRAPTFDEGGAFLAATDLPRAGDEGRPYPYGDAWATTATSATLPSSTAPPSSTTPAARPSASVVPTVTTQPSPDVRSRPRPPATGTYTYAVSGTEAATGFGSRTYPERATVVVHHGDRTRDDELVLDLRLSGQHEEREILRYSPSGVAFAFEGGSVTFGPGTQTSQASYDPLMVQIPFPLAVGASAKGASSARDASGNVARVETWTSKVVREETITVLGRARTVWVVDVQRNTGSGATEQVDRYRRYWYDPALGTWVKWSERFHGARRMVLDFTYDTTYTATLVGFTPAA